jgi:DNA-binding MarR family transcriptional regulator
MTDMNVTIGPDRAASTDTEARVSGETGTRPKSSCEARVEPRTEPRTEAKAQPKSEPTKTEPREAEPKKTEPTWDLIELLFFAYRDFVGDADGVLAELGFGRAHHRVLHFVNRSPGMKVAELLGILKITKQSLGRVLKQLIDEGYIVQQEGANDRRQRLLFVTDKGKQLALQLAGLQTVRIARAVAELGPDAHAEARAFLLKLIDGENRDDVLRLIDHDGQV